VSESRGPVDLAFRLALPVAFTLALLDDELRIDDTYISRGTLGVFTALKSNEVFSFSGVMEWA